VSRRHGSPVTFGPGGLSWARPRERSGMCEGARYSSGGACRPTRSLPLEAVITAIVTRDRSVMNISVSPAMGGDSGHLAPGPAPVLTVPNQKPP
jgi:hypothetical protein